MICQRFFMRLPVALLCGTFLLTACAKEGQDSQENKPTNEKPVIEEPTPGNSVPEIPMDPNTGDSTPDKPTNDFALTLNDTTLEAKQGAIYLANSGYVRVVVTDAFVCEAIEDVAIEPGKSALHIEIPSGALLLLPGSPGGDVSVSSKVKDGAVVSFFPFGDDKTKNFCTDDLASKVVDANTDNDGTVKVQRIGTAGKYELTLTGVTFYNEQGEEVEVGKVTIPLALCEQDFPLSATNISCVQ